MRTPALLGLHSAQLAFLLWLAWRTPFCCDAYYYMHMGVRLLDQGLFAADDFAGYRSYFVPLVFGLLQWLPAPKMPGQGESLPFTLSVAFTVISFLASRFILRRETRGRYLTFALPTLFNPFLLAHVPFPLQESVLMLLVVPVVVVMLAVRDRSPQTTLALAVLIASLAFIIRGSTAWLALPAAIFLALEIRRDAAAWRAAPRARLAALAVAIPLLLVAPQSAVMQGKFGTLNPYPKRDVLESQIFYGISMFKMTTMYHEGKWKQLRADTPWNPLPLEQKIRIAFYRENLGPAVFLVVAHVWAGLHYDVLTTYVKFEQLRILSPWILLSALVVAYGLVGMLRWLRAPGERSRALFAATTLALSCGYTAILGVEQRFGMLGFLALSLAAGQLAATREGRALMLRGAPLAVAYALLCLAFNAMLLYASPEI
ncbi:MAG TPA: hypothetical protein VFK48_15600 [Usitatibacter sp.]|nr:hypothetical protein [Usitatibacter sp.]